MAAGCVTTRSRDQARGRRVSKEERTIGVDGFPLSPLAGRGQGEGRVRNLGESWETWIARSKSAPHLTAMDGGNAENAGAVFGRLRHLLPAGGEKGRNSRCLARSGSTLIPINPIQINAALNQRLNRRVSRWKKPGFFCATPGAGGAAGVVAREPLSASRPRPLPFERGVACVVAALLSDFMDGLVS